MKIQIAIDIDVNDKVFEELKEIHEKPNYECGTQEQYDKAIKIIEDIIGLPFYANVKQEDVGKPCISAVNEFFSGTLILE